MLKQIFTLKRDFVAFDYFDNPIQFSASIDACGHGRAPRNYRWHGSKRGTRPCVIFQYTLQGEGHLRFDDQHYRLTTGDLMLLTVPHDHEYDRPAESSEWIFFWFTLVGSEAIRLFKWMIDRQGPLLSLYPTHPVIQKAFDYYLQSHSGKLNSPFLVSHAAYSLASLLCHESLMRETATAPDRIQSVIALLENDFRRDIGIDDMARCSGYSRYHFTRLFTQHTRRSPRQYLEDVRIRKACDLLRQHASASIQDVSSQVGFHEANYFAKVFRRVTGESPRDFRKQRSMRGYF